MYERMNESFPMKPADDREEIPVREAGPFVTSTVEGRAWWDNGCFGPAPERASQQSRRSVGIDSPNNYGTK